MSNNTDRNMLGFEDAVRKYFAFLEDIYGYKCIASDLYCVKYSSDKVYINIYHERISYELYFEIGMLPEKNNNPLIANLNDIVAMCSMLREKVLYQASNNNDVYTVVEKLAHITLTYAKDALNASVEYFKSVGDYRKQMQENALFLQELNLAEEKVKKAWNMKDYKTVVEVYSTIDNQLNPVQIKRLDYAKKMLMGNSAN